MAQRLMIIEDNIDLSHIYQKAFEATGFEVLCSHNGQEALRQIADFNPAVVLCDIKMPHLTGFDFIKILNSHPQLKAQTAIFILSAYGDAKMLKRAKELGVEPNRYLIKSQVALRQILNIITHHFKTQTATA